MITKVCIDLDGVMANFTKGACIACDVPYPSNSLFAESWLDEQCAANMWDRCKGHDYWANLEPFPWVAALRNLVAEHTDQWVFLTKAAYHYDPGCYSGKCEWIHRHFPDDLNRLWIMNGDKSMMCRGPGDLLIDDKLRSVKPWARAGGTIYHWAEITSDYPSEKVAARLEDIKGILKRQ